MSSGDKLRIPFQFLSDEEIRGLGTRARMAYYVLALAELNRRINGESDQDAAQVGGIRNTPDRPNLGSAQPEPD